jgi:hypothetical protein
MERRDGWWIRRRIRWQVEEGTLMPFYGSRLLREHCACLDYQHDNDNRTPILILL